MAIDTAEAGDLVDEAATHAADCRRAHDAADHSSFDTAHRRLTAALRAARACLRTDYGGSGADGSTIAVQTSSGSAPGGGTSGGRAGSPLMQGDLEGWLSRARVGAQRRR